MRPLIRSLLLLLLLGAVLMEALAWIRAPLFDALHRAYPHLGLDDEGRVVHFEDQKVLPGGSWARRLDDSRSAPEPAAAARAPLRFVASGPYRLNLDFDAPRFLVAELYGREAKPPPAPLDFLAMQLNGVESSRRGIPYFAHEAGDAVLTFTVGERETPPVLWSAEGGRLVCRDRGTRALVAGFGPDGYALEERAAEGARFGPVDGPFNSAPVREDRAEFLLLDVEERTIHAVAVPKPLPEAAGAAEAVAVSVEQRPFRPFRAGECETDTMPLLKIADRRMLVFLRDGTVILDVELEPGERVLMSEGALLARSAGTSGHHIPPQKPRFGDICVETALAPCSPDAERRRLRLLRPGQPDVVREAVLVPTRASEVLLANASAALVILRPPPLSLASAVSPLPSDHREVWWWRDPWLAGGRYTGWLALSVALAAFLAWRARRAARERCATIRAVRFWTAAVFLLGPVGFLWMRLVLPRVPVEHVGQARRAVNLDASPSTSAPWPDPKPLGIEVFQ